MKEYVSVPTDWPDKIIRNMIKTYCNTFKSSTKGFDGFKVETQNENKLSLSSGSKKSLKFLGAIKNEFSATIELNLDTSQKQIIIDFDEGTMLKVGKMGMKKRQNFWKIFSDGIREAIQEAIEEIQNKQKDS
ncbi:MAG: hypothetical protein ACFFCE_12135 [Promethearchaeota archaeon]